MAGQPKAQWYTPVAILPEADLVLELWQSTTAPWSSFGDANLTPTGH